MVGFQSPVDIANRALQLLRKPAIHSFTDAGSTGSREMGIVYDQLRLAELRRAVWRFATRRVILRAITTTTQLLVPAAWAVGTTYAPGDIVASGNETWVAVKASTGQLPGLVPAGGSLFWDSYFGNQVVDVWNAPVYPTQSTGAGALQPTEYWVGDLVYTTPGDGTYTIYRSLVSSNGFNPAQVDQWSDGTVYQTGQVAVFGGTNYQSLHGLNFNNQPSTSPSQWTTTITSPLVSNSWEAMTGATLAPLNILYPLGAGPTSDTFTLNAYKLPAGFLRQAPSDPKAGLPTPFLGGPTGNFATDWVLEGDFLTSQDSRPIEFRFCADVQSVVDFDPLFAEALATRLTIELAPRLVDADGPMLSAILGDARESYARSISEARGINGIEKGPVMPAEDAWITVRR